MAMYSYERSFAAPAISAIVPDPSLQSLCICKSPRNFFSRAGRLARSRRASASEMKSWRIAGTVFARRGGFSIQFRICFSMNGPTARSSVKPRFCARRSDTSFGQRNALRAARRNARERIPVSRFLVSAKLIPLPQAGLDISKRILRGAVLITIVLAAARAMSVYGIARIEDASTRFTLQRIAHLVVGLAVALIVVSIVFVNWYGAVAALGVGSIIIGLAVQTPMKSFIAWIYILVRQPF